MKIRLQIAHEGHTATFEHPGPKVVIGRDPTCELVLEGLASNGVSRRHAQIELTPGQATVSDLESSNGTLLNDKKLSDHASLHVNDCIRLGYTGPTITVIELELPAVVPKSPRSNEPRTDFAQPSLHNDASGANGRSGKGFDSRRAAILVAIVAGLFLFASLVVFAVGRFLKPSSGGTGAAPSGVTGTFQRPSESHQSEEPSPLPCLGGCALCGGGSIALIMIPVLVFCLNIALLVWVARDAKARGMDSAILWMILVMFTGLIGLVIFLFARPQGSLIRCADCGNNRLLASRRCPHCGNA